MPASATHSAPRGPQARPRGLFNPCAITVTAACLPGAWLTAPLAELAARGELMAYQHAGFWQPMDTLREKNLLEQLWASGKAPWKIW